MTTGVVEGWYSKLGSSKLCFERLPIINKKKECKKRLYLNKKALFKTNDIQSLSSCFKGSANIDEGCKGDVIPQWK